MPNSEASTNRVLHLEGVELPRGNYYLEKLVSISNMSVIYKAVDRSSQRHVAVKILLNERYFQRFRNEVNITWGQKNNIASAIRYDLEGERLSDGTIARYLVMKWLSGPSLADRIRAFRMEGKSTRELLSFATRLLSKLAPALDDMHRIGIVHLDIKPSNILFNSDPFESDEPYLIDFGIAQWIQTTQEEMTVVEVEDAQTSLVQVGAEHPGTANYMPPEQWTGTVESGATDQYALAVTVYEILSGRVSPFQEALDTLESTTTGSSGSSSRREMWRKAHESEPPTPIQKYRPEVPKAVWRVLLKAMDKDPRKRYANIVEFYHAFQSTAQQPLESPIPYTEFDRTRPETLFRGRSRSVTPLLLGVVVLLAGAGVVALALNGQQPPPDAGTPTRAALAAVTETTEPGATAAVVLATEAPPTNSASPTSEEADASAVVLETTEEPSASATELPTDAPTNTPTQTPTDEPTDTATVTLTRTPRATDTALPTTTATATPRPTRTPAVTSSATASTSPTKSQRPATATSTDIPTATPTNAPTRTIRPSNTPTNIPTNTRTNTRTSTATFTVEPSDTPTPTATRTPSSTPSATLTSTPEPRTLSALLTQIADASRSANNFNCVTFIDAYDELDSRQSSLTNAEASVITPLFGRSSPLVALNQFCAAPANREDETAQLPSNLASDEFRDLRTIIRTVIRAVEGMEETDSG